MTITLDNNKVITRKMAAFICIVCFLVGACLSAVLTWDLHMRIMQDAATQEPIEGTEQADPLTPQQIYEKAVKETVYIKTYIDYVDFYGEAKVDTSDGSGFVISPDGYIVTNYHVIEHSLKNNHGIDVEFADGSAYKAKLIGYEDLNDFAVIKIDAKGLNACTLGDSNSTRVGEPVCIVGNPYGEFQWSLSTGVVSALDRELDVRKNGVPIHMFQTDAAINSGNSGGPVYNEKGEVIGIASASWSSHGGQDLGFAIPISDVREYAEDLMLYGKIPGRASLGVEIDTEYDPAEEDSAAGVRIAMVKSGSVADIAGFHRGDIITKIGDSDVIDYNGYVNTLKSYKAGDVQEVQLIRNGETLVFRMTFEEQPSI